MPHAKSTTSKPRWRDPFASEKTFPCSSDIILAMPSKSFSIRDLNLKSILLLFVTAVSAQDD